MQVLPVATEPMDGTRAGQSPNRISHSKGFLQGLGNFPGGLVVKTWHWDFPGSAVGKNPPANAGDTGSILGPGRSHMPQSS